MVFRQERTIRENQVDVFQHLNNLEYLRMFEELRWDWLMSLGLSFPVMLVEKVGPVVLEVQAEYVREVRLRDRVVLEGALGAFDEPLFEYHHRMLHEDGTLACSARIQFGFIGFESRALINPPERWLQLLVPRESA